MLALNLKNYKPLRLLNWLGWLLLKYKRVVFFLLINVNEIVHYLFTAKLVRKNELNRPEKWQDLSEVKLNYPHYGGGY